MGRLFFVSRALGIGVSFPLVLFVAITAALLTIAPFTPGGLAIVEPGIVGLLLLTLERHDAVSIALVDRSISYLSVIALGGLAFIVYQLARGRSAPHRQRPNAAA